MKVAVKRPFFARNPTARAATTLHLGLALDFRMENISWRDVWNRGVALATLMHGITRAS